MRPLKVKVSISIDNDLVPVVKNLADKSDRSFSQYINIIIKNHVANLKKKKRRF